MPFGSADAETSWKSNFFDELSLNGLFLQQETIGSQSDLLELFKIELYMVCGEDLVIQLEQVSKLLTCKAWQISPFLLWTGRISKLIFSRNTNQSDQQPTEIVWKFMRKRTHEIPIPMWKLKKLHGTWETQNYRKDS